MDWGNETLAVDSVLAYWHEERALTTSNSSNLSFDSATPRTSASQLCLRMRSNEKHGRLTGRQKNTGISINWGTPACMVYKGTTMKNVYESGCFGGTPISGNLDMSKMNSKCHSRIGFTKRVVDDHCRIGLEMPWAFYTDHDSRIFKQFDCSKGATFGELKQCIFSALARYFNLAELQSLEEKPCRKNTCPIHTCSSIGRILSQWHLCDLYGDLSIHTYIYIYTYIYICMVIYMVILCRHTIFDLQGKSQELTTPSGRSGRSSEKGGLLAGVPAWANIEKAAPPTCWPATSPISIHINPYHPSNVIKYTGSTNHITKQWCKNMQDVCLPNDLTTWIGQKIQTQPPSKSAWASPGFRGILQEPRLNLDLGTCSTPIRLHLFSRLASRRASRLVFSFCIRKRDMPCERNVHVNAMWKRREEEET